MLKILLSFDDNCKQNLRGAEMLKKHGFDATFYICNEPAKGCEAMTSSEIKELAQDFTIGGHTVTHPMDMKVLPDDRLDWEVKNNRDWLRGITGQKVQSFCYPRGRHSDRVRAAVRKAGYHNARTTVIGQITNDSNDPYQTPTTVHAFQRPEYQGLHWLVYAKDQFKQALEASKLPGNECFYHLWGHFWELEQNAIWGEFEELLEFINNHKPHD